MAPILSHAATLAQHLGDRRRSQAYYQEALDLMNSLPRKEVYQEGQIATLEGNIALQLFHQGRFDEALGLFRQASKRPGVEPICRAMNLNNQAKIALRRGDTMQAENLCLEAFRELQCFHGKWKGVMWSDVGWMGAG